MILFATATGTFGTWNVLVATEMICPTEEITDPVFLDIEYVPWPDLIFGVHGTWGQG